MALEAQEVYIVPRVDNGLECSLEMFGWDNIGLTIWKSLSMGKRGQILTTVLGEWLES